MTAIRRHGFERKTALSRVRRKVEWGARADEIEEERNVMEAEFERAEERPDGRRRRAAGGAESSRRLRLENVGCRERLDLSSTQRSLDDGWKKQQQQQLLQTVEKRTAAETRWPKRRDSDDNWVLDVHDVTSRKHIVVFRRHLLLHSCKPNFPSNPLTSYQVSGCMTVAACAAWVTIERMTGGGPVANATNAVLVKANRRQPDGSFRWQWKPISCRLPSIGEKWQWRVGWTSTSEDTGR